MKDGRTLPATLLIPRQLPELGDDSLPRPALRSLRFDQREIGVSLAVPSKLRAMELHRDLSDVATELLQSWLAGTPSGRKGGRLDRKSVV